MDGANRSAPSWPTRRGASPTAPARSSPEYRRHARYRTMATAEIAALPVAAGRADDAHLYLWVPNALLADGLAVMQGWGFTYKANLVWHKVLGDGRSDRRGVGFYFRNVTELVLFGVRGSMRTLPPGRRQVNLVRQPQARALPQARAAVRHRRVVLPRPLPRAVRPAPPPRVGGLGRRGDGRSRRRLTGPAQEGARP